MWESSLVKDSRHVGVFLSEGFKACWESFSEGFKACWESSIVKDSRHVEVF